MTGACWLLCAGVMALYVAGVRRRNRSHPLSPLPRYRPIAFGAGVLTVAVALGFPLDAYANMFFAAHMAQHLLLTMVAAPLLLLGTPVVLARQTAPLVFQRVVASAVHSPILRGMLFPAVTWGTLTAVLWGSHYSSLYEAALENPAVHTLEHALYLGAALLFWFPVVALEPSPWRMGYPLRVLYLFAAAPLNAFLGMSLYQSARPLYPHYAILARLRGTSPLADQQAGGVIMWIVGGLLLVVAILGVAASWAHHDARVARHADAKLGEASSGG